MESTHDTIISERKNATFNVNKMSAWWVGSEDLVDFKKRILKVIEEDPDFKKIGPAHVIYRLNKQERYLKAAERFHVVQNKIKTKQVLKPPYNIRSGKEMFIFQSLALGPDTHTSTIQYAMFIPTLKNQTSKDQRENWLPAAESLAILGCYGQTEMAHGSDVQGLQTEARYDPKSKCFDLHSPTTGSTKWWPAALGRTATHAIIHARLLLPSDYGYKDYGVKPFLVQLRDMETHQNLPGIISGDIGPTMGLVAVEEGFCSFDHVKIPLEALLARYGHVNPNGEWISPPAKFGKRTYATMLSVRARFVAISSDFLGKGATIAIRYCAVRRQFKNPGTSVENQVIDYQQVQVRTLPWVATVYALKCTGRYMMNMHKEMERMVEEQGDTTMEKQVHAIGSSLKAVCTSLAVDGLEELRRVCGGYGFSIFSGFQDLYGNAMVNFTGEGENYMLIQQSTHALLRLYNQSQSGEKISSPMFSFINTPATSCAWPVDQNFIDCSLLAFIQAFEVRAQYLLANTAEQAGDSHDPMRGAAQWEGIQAAWAFGQLVILKSFVDTIETAANNEHVELVATFEKLCRLFAVNLMIQNLQDYLMCGYLSSSQGANLKEGFLHMLKKIRPDAVALVDSFCFSDGELNSALGREDGKVYETLLEWAKADPMNEGTVIDGFQQYYGDLLRNGQASLEKRSGKSLGDRSGIIQGIAKL